MANAAQLIFGDEVHLVQENSVGKGNLLEALVGDAFRLLLVEVQHHMLGIHHRQDAVKSKLQLQVLVREECLRHRTRVREPRRLYEHGVEALLALCELREDAHEVSTHGAAHAPVVHLEELLLRLDAGADELVVDAHLAEFVLNHRDFESVVFLQYVVDERGLPASEEPRDDRHRYLSVGHVSRRRRHFWVECRLWECEKANAWGETKPGNHAGAQSPHDQLVDHRGNIAATKP